MMCLYRTRWSRLPSSGIDFLNPSRLKISVQESPIMTRITLLWGGTADIINISTSTLLYQRSLFEAHGAEQAIRKEVDPQQWARSTRQWRSWVQTQTHSISNYGDKWNKTGSRAP